MTPSQLTPTVQSIVTNFTEHYRQSQNEFVIPEMNPQSSILSKLSEDSQEPEKDLSIDLCLEDICISHDRTQDIVCLKDKQLVCSKCVLFGIHKNHPVITLEQLESDRHAYMLRTCNIKRQKISLPSVHSQQSLKDKFSQTRYLLEQRVRTKIQKLRVLLGELESKTIQQIGVVIEDKQNQVFEQLRQNSSRIDISYLEWEETSIKETIGLNSQDLPSQLQILKYDNPHLTNNNSMGDLLSSHQNTIQTIIQKALEQVKLIRVQTDTSIQTSITKSMVVTSQLQLEYLPLYHYISNGEEKLLENLANIQSLMTVTYEPTFQDLAISINMNPQKSLQTSFYESQTTSNTSATSRVKTRKLQKSRIPKSRTLNLSPKYQRVVDDLLVGKTQTLDLTNAQLGDTVCREITSHLKGSNCNYVKLIRNKLTDDGLKHIMDHLSNVCVLNLSCNMLTEASVRFIVSNIQKLPKLTNLILSQNKIQQRNVKDILGPLRNKNIIVSF